MNLFAMSLPLSLAATASSGGVSVTQIDTATAAHTCRIDPAYSAGPGHRRASLRVINVYRITLPHNVRIESATSPGYLPVELKLSDGRCVTIAADYDRTFRNTRMSQNACSPPRRDPDEKPAVMPRAGLRLTARSWGFGLWRDDRSGMSYVTNAWGDRPQVLFTTSLRPLAIAAMRSPDAPGADMTLVGWLHGRPAVVTVEIGY